MYVLGRYIIVELYGCDKEVFNNCELIEKIMVELVFKVGVEVREVVFYKFLLQGVSGVVVIFELYLIIYIWLEFGYVVVDVFICGERVDLW